MANIDVKWQVWWLNLHDFPSSWSVMKRCKEQVKSRKVKPQVMKEGTRTEEATAAKETLDVWNLRGARRWNTGELVKTVPPFLHIPRLTTPAWVKIIRTELVFLSFFFFFFFFLYIFYHVPSRHISSTPEVFLFTNSINFHNSPMRQIKLLAPVRWEKQSLASFWMKHRRLRNLLRVFKLNGWKSSCRICGLMTLQAAWAGQGGEKPVNLSPSPGVITF